MIIVVFHLLGVKKALKRCREQNKCKLLGPVYTVGCGDCQKSCRVRLKVRNFSLYFRRKMS